MINCVPRRNGQQAQQHANVPLLSLYRVFSEFLYIHIFGVFGAIRLFLRPAHIKKCVPDSVSTLQLNVANAPPRTTPGGTPEWEVTYTLDLRNLRHVNLRKGVTKCRDRHRRARPIICVSFWAVMSSLCVAISLFIPFPYFLPYNRTDFGQYISARIV